MWFPEFGWVLPEFLQAPPDFSRLACLAWPAWRAGLGSGVEVPRSVSVEGLGYLRCCFG